MAKYKITMFNGNSAEADTIAAAMLAAETMAREGADAEGWDPVLEVLVGGEHRPWAWNAIIEHTIEVEASELPA